MVSIFYYWIFIIPIILFFSLCLCALAQQNGIWTDPLKAAKEADYSKAFLEFLADYTTEEGVDRDLHAGFVNASHHGINRVLFGNSDASHYVYFGGTDLDDLIQNMKAMLSSEEYNSFNTRVEAMRTVRNSALMEVIKAYPVEREKE